MKSNFLQNFFCAVFIFTITGCTKTQDFLPSETQIGAYTIGFKVNGKIFKATGNRRQMGILTFGYINYVTNQTDSSILISGGKSTGDSEFKIWFSLKYRDTTGTYLLTGGPYKGTFFLGGDPNPDDPSGSNMYYTDSVYTGNVTVKYFDGKFTPYNMGTILSGTFEMDARNISGKVIHITDGRFDIGNN